MATSSPDFSFGAGDCKGKAAGWHAVRYVLAWFPRKPVARTLSSTMIRFSYA
jgi:hypothetical protein